MPTEAPQIDPRDDGQIVAQLETLAERYTAGRWRRAAGQVDAGGVLMRVFAAMATQAIERLNRAPEKNFLAFLDLIGVQQLPPQPARAPLTFSLAPGSNTEALVPAGTRAAAPPSEGLAEELVFETERDLVLTPAVLGGVFVHEPAADRLADRTAPALGERDEPFAAFTGAEAIEHSLYLAWEGLLTLAAPKSATLTFSSTSTAQLAALAPRWEYWDGAAWRPLTATPGAAGATWPVTIDALPAPLPQSVAGTSAGWIRARLDRPLIPAGVTPPAGGYVSTANVPQITGLTASFRVPAVTGPPARQAFFNTTPLDLSKDFSPFGERPAFNDTLYLSAHPTFARPNALVTLDVKLAKAGVGSALQFAWEVWSGDGWREVTGLTDGTQGFTRDGAISFRLPSQVASGTVNGAEGFWMRARLTGGNYGTEMRYQPLLDASGQPRREGSIVLYQQISPGYSPPVVRSLRLGYETNDVPPSAVLAYNNLSATDYTAAVANRQPFIPFAALEETRPALYLGFDRPFAARRVTLYAQVAPPPADSAAAPSTAQVVWEYLGAQGWRLLGAEDATGAFAERGLVTFVGPPDLAARERFGRRLHWLRARWDSGALPTMPRLRRLLLNTTWASQTFTATDEVLGSSDGSPGQRFFTTNAPVLQGQRVEVLEHEEPPPAELATLGGPAALTPAIDAAGLRPGVWVRWRQVPDFYGSGPRDRHYVLDYLAGEVRFGDGRRGLIPPVGRNVVRAGYRTGGGARGNRPTGSITQLKTAIPAVAGVTNHEPAAGGADAETTAEVQERGPRTLRHRGRAVTAQDIEDLAREASPEVARARLVAPRFDPLSLGDQWLDPAVRLPNDQVTQRLAMVTGAGTAELILVPRGQADRPALSQELVGRVVEYLRARRAPTFDLRIREADWVRVGVTAEVVPASLEAAETLVANVTAALRRFLHPLTGGPDRAGWAFGRKVYVSDLYALIEGLPGVGYVYSLALSGLPEGALAEQALIYSGDHTISIRMPERWD